MGVQDPKPLLRGLVSPLALQCSAASDQNSTQDSTRSDPPTLNRNRTTSLALLSKHDYAINLSSSDCAVIILPAAFSLVLVALKDILSGPGCLLMCGPQACHAALSHAVLRLAW